MGSIPIARSTIKKRPLPGAFAFSDFCDDANGNAVLDLGAGNTVKLIGVRTADLSEASFHVGTAVSPYDPDPVWG